MAQLKAEERARAAKVKELFETHRHERGVTHELLRQHIAQRQGWRCADPFGCCPQRGRQFAKVGSRDLFEVDHIRRWSDGGDSRSSNVQALCPSCHGAKTVAERSKSLAIRQVTYGKPQAGRKRWSIIYKKPPGHHPKGKVWDYDTGFWKAEE